MKVSRKEAMQAYNRGWLYSLNPENVPDLQEFLQAFQIEAASGDYCHFDFNIVQQRICEEIQKCYREGRPIRFIILKARQMGCSTLIDGFIFERVVRMSGQKCIIAADDDDNTVELYESKVKELWEQIPKEVQPKKLRSSMRELLVRHKSKRLKDGTVRRGGRSYVRVLTAGKESGGRSKTIQHAHFSEAAFYGRKAATFFLGTLQSIHDYPNTSIIIESTANGAAGEFFERWNAAVKGLSEYTPLFFPWFVFPEYKKPFKDADQLADFILQMDEEERDIQKQFKLNYEQMYWRRGILWNKCNGDLLKFQQEYPATPEEAFIASGTCRFNRLSLANLEKKKPKEIARGWITLRNGIWEFIEDDKRPDVILYRKPIPGREVISGADFGEGFSPGYARVEGDETKGDPSTANFYDRRSRRLMARVRCWKDPEEFAKLLYRLGKYFGDALLVPERNGPGVHGIKWLRKMGYPRIYIERVPDSVSGKIQDRYGYSTQTQSRETGISALASEISFERVELAQEQIDECRTFSLNEAGTKFEGLGGNGDDEVSALWCMAAVNFDTAYEPMPEKIVPKRQPTRVERHEEAYFARISRGAGDFDEMMGSEA